MRSKVDHNKRFFSSFKKLLMMLPAQPSLQMNLLLVGAVTMNTCLLGKLFFQVVFPAPDNGAFHAKFCDIPVSNLPLS